MKTVKKASLVFALIFTSLLSQAETRPIHEIHSMMIYNFVKYVQWPEHISTKEFVIGVIGDDNIHNTLKVWYDGKVRQEKKIIIKKFSNVADIKDCHILYIGAGATSRFAVIAKTLTNKSTLTIANRAGLGKKGCALNFMNVNGKLGFELNQGAIKRANLRVSSQLTSMATLL